MLPGERRVGGLSCGEVLALMDDFLDGELDAERVPRVLAHVEGCDVCARFSERYAALIAAFRQALGPTDATDADGARLWQKISARLDRDSPPSG